MFKYIFVEDLNSGNEFTFEESDFREYAEKFVKGVDTGTAKLEDIFDSLICAEIHCKALSLSDLAVDFLFQLNVEENETSYEFELQLGSLHYREYDTDMKIFRLVVNNENKNWEVFEAYYEDYDIGVDVTYMFDDELIATLHKHIKEKGVLLDNTVDYLNFYKEREMYELATGQ